MLLETFYLFTEEEVSIGMTVFIESEMAARFINESEKLEDIIVLHLDGGKDFFISITGNFLQTCFGSSLETLIHVHSYIRDVPTAELLDLTLVHYIYIVIILFIHFFVFSLLHGQSMTVKQCLLKEVHYLH